MSPTNAFFPGIYRDMLCRDGLTVQAVCSLAIPLFSFHEQLSLKVEKIVILCHIRFSRIKNFLKS